MEINADISFGLESQVTELVETIKDGVNKAKELVMKISDVKSSVWCGVAFLRGQVGNSNPYERWCIY
jgi:hypothetical protein